VARLVLPETHTLAVVEYAEPQDARCVGGVGGCWCRGSVGLVLQGVCQLGGGFGVGVGWGVGNASCVLSHAVL